MISPLPGQPGASPAVATPIEKPPSPMPMEQQRDGWRAKALDLEAAYNIQKKRNGDLEAQIANWLAKERRGECPFDNRDTDAAMVMVQVHRGEATANVCGTCRGEKQVADTEPREPWPWSAWANRHPFTSRPKPIPCPECCPPPSAQKNGTGP